MAVISGFVVVVGCVGVSVKFIVDGVEASL